LENVQQVSISKCGHLDCHDIGTYGMGARAEGSGTTSTKATGKCRCPNSVTFVGVLNACASIVALEEGRFAHEKLIQNGCELDVFVGNILVDMYATCRSVEDGWKVFHKMIS
jgi:pentatricopeptide repeat protein